MLTVLDPQQNAKLARFRAVPGGRTTPMPDGSMNLTGPAPDRTLDDDPTVERGTRGAAI